MLIRVSIADKLIFISMLSNIIPESMEAGRKASKQKTEELVEFKLYLPRKIADFLTYAAQRLQIRKENLALMMIGDSLAALSGYMLDEFSSKWMKFMDFAYGETALSIEFDYALANLAAIFTKQYNNPRFRESITFEEEILENK